jgi:peptidyl-prolyl cis-trans isomerase SurA
MRRARAVAALSLLLASLIIEPARATPPLVVDTIVAIVDREIILASELEARAIPYKMQLADPKPTPAAERAVYREVLDRMIDDALIQKIADDKRISVETAEVDAGIQSVAQHNQMTKEQIFEAAKALGMSEAAYRADVRRQIFEGKVFSLHRASTASARTTLPPDDAARAKQLEAERVAWLKTLRAAAHVEIRFKS